MPQLQFPNISHKQFYLDMIAEWGNSETIPTSPAKLFAGESFEQFLELVESDIAGVEGFIPAHLFFLMDMNDAKILGAIQIRHSIDHPNLLEVGGHIGYGIRPSERGKGYATKMLGLALLEAKKIGLEKVLITCNNENIASAKVIENNGGFFERFAEKDGKKMRRYWITLL